MELKDLYDELERLRKKEKLTEKDLSKDIMSVRSYRRYHYLEHDMPFDKLEALCKRLHTSIYDVLYYVEHNAVETNMEEAVLLDLLIQDNYEAAAKKLKTMDPSQFKISSKQFLLPLFLLKLDVHQKKMTLEDANQKMFDALNLRALLEASWMTVDHYILMEHLLPWMTIDHKKMCQAILKQVISKEKVLIRPSNYALMKVYMFDLLLSLELGIDKTAIEHEVYAMFQSMFHFGSEMVVDEIMTFLIAYHVDDFLLIRKLLNTYLIPLSYVYHVQSVHDDPESVDYIKKHHHDMIVSLRSFKEDLL
jgi:transcriptional regulator with XRE-family HTH domain